MITARLGTRTLRDAEQPPALILDAQLVVVVVVVLVVSTEDGIPIVVRPRTHTDRADLDALAEHWASATIVMASSIRIDKAYFIRFSFWVRASHFLPRYANGQRLSIAGTYAASATLVGNPTLSITRFVLIGYHEKTVSLPRSNGPP